MEVRELLNHLGEGARVLDLGCGEGGFSADAGGISIVRVDVDPKRLDRFVQADAARLPFGARSFDAVVSNHSLEHIGSLEEALREIGRVVKPSGLLYVAVPDASTVTDRLYRWLGRGGGHVNAFTSAEKLAARIERETGLKHAGTRTLLSSLAFMNRANQPNGVQKKVLLLGGGRAWSLNLATYAMRWMDRVFGTRLSVYGWALFFGSFPGAIDASVRSNVCIRCGSGHAADGLPRSWMYRCPSCGARNLFMDERGFQRIR